MTTPKQRRWLVRDGYEGACYRVVVSTSAPTQVKMHLSTSRGHVGVWQGDGPDGSSRRVCNWCLQQLRPGLDLPPGGGPVELTG
jgi:hypothetical protein